MTAGLLNQRIKIKERVYADNTRGEKTYTYAQKVEVYSQVNPKRGREYLAAAQLQGEGPAVFRIRYRSDLDNTMVVEWRGVNYEIKSPPVAVDGGIEWIDLYCSKGIGDARKTG